MVRRRREFLGWLSGMALAAGGGALARGADRARVTLSRGAIVRGPRDLKRLALVFTADQFAEGAATIFPALARRKAKAACFLTGRFLRASRKDAVLKGALDAAIAGGHEIGPHSDEHLLYAEWERPYKLLVTREQFGRDLAANDREIAGRLGRASGFRYFLPPYEHYTEEVARWTSEAGHVLINYTPGSLSHADYMEDDHPRFVTADRIVESILQVERSDPDGLNGFLLLMHLGAGPRRTRDHLADRLDGLLGTLQGRGYAFVGVSELLGA